MKEDDNVRSDDDSVGSDDAVGPFQYGLNTPPTVEYKLDSEDGNPTVPKSFWSMEDHREPKVHYSDTSSSQSDETEAELESYTAEPVSSPDEADAAYAAGLIHGDDKSVSLSPHVKAVIKQVADADSEDSDDEDSEDVDTSFNQVTSPSSLVNKFSPTILTRLSEEDEDKDPTDIDEDKENRSDTKEQPNEQSYTPLSISNEEQSYAPLSIPNKSVADFFDKNPTNQPDSTEAQKQVRKQYSKVLEELKQRGVVDSNLMAKDKATELTDKLLGTQNDEEQLSSKAAVVKTPFLQPRLSHQGNDNFSQELDAGTQRGAATVETPVDIAHLFQTPSDPDKKGSGGGRAKYREDTPFNSKAVTFADNKLGRWASPNDEESSIDANDAKNKVSSYTPVPYNSKTGTFTAPSLDDEESEDTEVEKEASEEKPCPSPNTKPGVFTAPSDESSPLSGYELVESPEEGKVTNTSVIWPTDEKRTTTNKSPTETINLTNQFDTEPALVLQDLLDMSYVASTPDASSCNVHHKRRVMFIIRHKKVAEDIVAMILRNDGHEIELMDLAEKFDRFM